MNNPLLILVAIIFGLSILTINVSINSAMAREAHGALPPVVQEQVNTGNPNVDKQINEFYHCISRTHEDPPSIQTVDNCYYQNSGGYYQSSIGGTASAHPPPGVLAEVANSNNNHDNNVKTHSTTASAHPAPGVLVEVA